MRVKIFNHNSLLTGLVALIFGALLAYFKNDFIDLFVMGAGILLLIAAVTSFIKFLSKTRDCENRWSFLPFSVILLAIMGLLFLLFPKFWVTIGEIFIALLVLILALGKLMLLSGLQRNGVHVGIWYYVMPSLLLIAGVVAMTDPEFTLGTLSVVLGIMIMAFGLSEIADYCIIHNEKLKKRFGSLSVEDENTVEDVEYTEIKEDEK